MPTATERDVARLKQYNVNLKKFLRKERVFNQQILSKVRILCRRAGISGPTVTTPPNPPFRP